MVNIGSIFGNVIKLVFIFLVLIGLQKLGVFAFIYNWLNKFNTEKRAIDLSDKRKRNFMRMIKRKVKLNDEI